MEENRCHLTEYSQKVDKKWVQKFGFNLGGRVYELGDAGTPFHENVCGLMSKKFYDSLILINTFDFDTPLLKTEDDYQLFKTIVCK